VAQPPMKISCRPSIGQNVSGQVHPRQRARRRGKGWAAAVEAHDVRLQPMANSKKRTTALLLQVRAPIFKNCQAPGPKSKVMSSDSSGLTRLFTPGLLALFSCELGILIIGGKKFSPAISTQNKARCGEPFALPMHLQENPCPIPPPTPSRTALTKSPPEPFLSAILTQHLRAICTVFRHLLLNAIPRNAYKPHGMKRLQPFSPPWGEGAERENSLVPPGSAALLDNPIWSALTTDHASLALGGGHARCYPADIGPLSGMPVQSLEGYAALASIVEPGSVAALFLREPHHLPPGWTLVRDGPLIQMIAAEPKLARIHPSTDVELRKLTAADSPAMVELARLTEPGPFQLRTLELGTFFGILQAGRLLAMAGKRLHMPGFIEVSGVCTHPEARGRGYAHGLMSLVMDEIMVAGRTPILHSYAHNEGAIRVYNTLGFRIRQTFELAAIRRTETS
jgi:ribosomal protein S18 acetylase RimI-like enzyme